MRRGSCAGNPAGCGSPRLLHSRRGVGCGMGSQHEGLQVTVVLTGADDESAVVDAGGAREVPARVRRYQITQAQQRAGVPKEGVEGTLEDPPAAYDLAPLGDRRHDDVRSVLLCGTRKEYLGSAAIPVRGVGRRGLPWSR